MLLCLFFYLLNLHDGFLKEVVRRVGSLLGTSEFWGSPLTVLRWLAYLLGTGHFLGLFPVLGKKGLGNEKETSKIFPYLFCSLLRAGPAQNNPVLAFPLWTLSESP